MGNGLPSLEELNKKQSKELPDIGALKKKEQIGPPTSSDLFAREFAFTEDQQRANELRREKGEYLAQRFQTVTDSMSTALQNEKAYIDAIRGANESANTAKSIIELEATKLINNGSLTEEQGSQKVREELQKVFQAELENNQAFQSVLEEYDKRTADILNKEEREFMQQKIQKERGIGISYRGNTGRKIKPPQGEGFLASAFNAIEFTIPSAFKSEQIIGHREAIDDYTEKLEEFESRVEEEGLEDDDRRPMDLLSGFVADIELKFGKDPDDQSVGAMRKHLQEGVKFHKEQTLKKLTDAMDLQEKFSAVENSVELKDVKTLSGLKKLLGQQLPQVALSVVMPVAGSYVQETGNIFLDNLRAFAAKDNGISEGEVTKDQMLAVLDSDQADEIMSKAELAGGVSGSLDVIGLGKMGTAFRPLVKNIVKGGLKGKVADFAKNTIGTGLVEGITEGLQGVTADVSKADVLDEEIKLDADKILTESAAGAAVGVMLGGLGSGIRQTRQYFKKDQKIPRREAAQYIEDGDTDGLIVQGDKVLEKKLTGKTDEVEIDSFVTPEVTFQESKLLKGKTVDVNFVTEDGETGTIQQDALETQNTIKKRRKLVEKLKDCINS